MEIYLSMNIAIKIGGYTFEKYLINTSAMTEWSLTVEPLWFMITCLLVFLHRIKLFKVFQVSFESFEHSVTFSGSNYFKHDVE